MDFKCIAEAFAIKRIDATACAGADVWYRHDYPCGRWVNLGAAQMYATRNAASRQANRLNADGHAVEYRMIQIREQ